MSEFRAYWKGVCRANPDLASCDTLRLSQAAFRQALECAFRAGKGEPEPEGTVLERLTDIFFNRRAAK